MTKQDKAKNILAFLEWAEKLKTVQRHSYTSKIDRLESVAEHTWMSALLGMLLLPEIGFTVDSLKVLKMILIHDLAETVIGDIPAFEVSKRQNNKQKAEREGMKKLVAPLSAQVGQEIVALWEEFETGESNEAKLAFAIDKAEVLIQHDLADIATWEQGDYDLALGHRDEAFAFDDFLKTFKQTIDKQTLQKIKTEGDLTRLRPEQRAIVEELQ